MLLAVPRARRATTRYFSALSTQHLALSTSWEHLRVYYAFGRFVYRHRFAVLAAWVVALIVSLPFPPPDLTMRIGGGPAFYADVETVSQRDLARAEAFAFPIAIIALLMVFGGVLAAGLPVLVGGAGVVVILATIYAFGRMMELSIFT